MADILTAEEVGRIFGMNHGEIRLTLNRQEEFEWLLKSHEALRARCEQAEREKAQAEGGFTRFERQIIALAKDMNDAYGSLAVDIQDFPAIIQTLCADRVSTEEKLRQAERERDEALAADEEVLALVTQSQERIAALEAHRKTAVVEWLRSRMAHYAHTMAVNPWTSGNDGVHDDAERHYDALGHELALLESLALVPDETQEPHP